MSRRKLKPVHVTLAGGAALVVLALLCSGLIRPGGRRQPEDGPAPAPAPAARTDVTEQPEPTKAPPVAAGQPAAADAEPAARPAPPKGPTNPPSVTKAEGGADAEEQPRLVKIPSLPIQSAWRDSDRLAGKRVRLTGEADLKRTANGVYAVFQSPTGLRLATVTVRNADAESLRGLEVGAAERRQVNLETTVRGGSGGQLVLDDSEFLPLDAPDGFAALDPPAYPAGSPGRVGEPKEVAKEEPPSGRLTPSRDRPASPAPGIALLPGAGRTVQVRGYYRNGQYVRGYSRSVSGGRRR